MFKVDHVLTQNDEEVGLIELDGNQYVAENVAQQHRARNCKQSYPCSVGLTAVAPSCTSTSQNVFRFYRLMMRMKARRIVYRSSH